MNDENRHIKKYSFYFKIPAASFCSRKKSKTGSKTGKTAIKKERNGCQHQQNIKLHANNIREARHLKICSWSRRLKILNKECSLFKNFKLGLDKPLSKYTSCARLDTIASGMEETNVIRDCEHRQYITCIC